MNKKKILWVEDVFDEIISILSELVRDRHELVMLNTVSAAEAILKANQVFDIVFLDSRFPGDNDAPSHNGSQLYLDLRSGRWGDWGKRVPVLFFTGFYQDVIALTAGCRPDEILQKPIGVAEAAETLAKYNITINVENWNAGNIKIHDQSHLQEAIIADGDYVYLKKLINVLIEQELWEAVSRLSGIVESKDNPNAQQAKLNSWRDWLSSTGDQVREGLRTSASVTIVGSALLKLLGFLP